ncbi:hypothetical protein L1987_36186 [Smallanthus sonchifolius]|uniref:Uncharacterized protein n=1 Tax=Smallanthus sonchifolius TaxID=185202 RepID=A0ACB9HCV9_9ASTR|nr:hypothetical protein L1987_36186 [Smallanthus sonchifolius]
MANVHIGDDVVRNILVRLPGKSLLRFRCASKHWNHLISDPYFMKSRFTQPLALIDDNVAAEDEAHSIVRIGPLEHQEKDTDISIVGTLNVSCIGIVALNVKEMVFSKVKLPYELEPPGFLLGSLDGCLCMVNKTGVIRFDVWLMKEECSWMKAHSFTFGLEDWFVNITWDPMFLLFLENFMRFGYAKDLIIAF